MVDWGHAAKMGIGHESAACQYTIQFILIKIRSIFDLLGFQEIDKMCTFQHYLIPPLF